MMLFYKYETNEKLHIFLSFLYILLNTSKFRTYVFLVKNTGTRLSRISNGTLYCFSVFLLKKIAVKSPRPRVTRLQNFADL